MKVGVARQSPAAGRRLKGPQLSQRLAAAEASLHPASRQTSGFWESAEQLVLQVLMDLLEDAD